MGGLNTGETMTDVPCQHCGGSGDLGYDPEEHDLTKSLECPSCHGWGTVPAGESTTDMQQAFRDARTALRDEQGRFDGRTPAQVIHDTEQSTHTAIAEFLRREADLRDTNPAERQRLQLLARAADDERQRTYDEQQARQQRLDDLHEKYVAAAVAWAEGAA